MHSDFCNISDCEKCTGVFTNTVLADISNILSNVSDHLLITELKRRKVAQRKLEDKRLRAKPYDEKISKLQNELTDLIAKRDKILYGDEGDKR